MRLVCIRVNLCLGFLVNKIVTLLLIYLGFFRKRNQRSEPNLKVSEFHLSSGGGNANILLLWLGTNKVEP